MYSSSISYKYIYIYMYLYIYIYIYIYILCFLSAPRAGVVGNYKFWRVEQCVTVVTFWLKPKLIVFDPARPPRALVGHSGWGLGWRNESWGSSPTVVLVFLRREGFPPCVNISYVNIDSSRFFGTVGVYEILSKSHRM